MPHSHEPKELGQASTLPVSNRAVVSVGFVYPCTRIVAVDVKLQKARATIATISGEAHSRVSVAVFDVLRQMLDLKSFFMLLATKLPAAEDALTVARSAALS